MAIEKAIDELEVQYFTTTTFANLLTTVHNSRKFINWLTVEYDDALTPPFSAEIKKLQFQKSCA